MYQQPTRNLHTLTNLRYAYFRMVTLPKRPGGIEPNGILLKLPHFFRVFRNRNRSLLYFLLFPGGVSPSAPAPHTPAAGVTSPSPTPAADPRPLNPAAGSRVDAPAARVARPTPAGLRRPAAVTATCKY